MLVIHSSRNEEDNVAEPSGNKDFIRVGAVGNGMSVPSSDASSHDSDEPPIANGPAPAPAPAPEPSAALSAPVLEDSDESAILMPSELRKVRIKRGMRIAQRFSTDNWCKDDLTLCWGLAMGARVQEDKDTTIRKEAGKPRLSPERIRRRQSGANYFMNMFSGIRISAEWGGTTYIVQRGQQRFKESLLLKGTLIGLETNIFRGWFGVNASFITPFSVTFDEKSQMAEHLSSSDSNSLVPVRYGWMVGISLFDGILRVGRGRLIYDRRYFLEGTEDHFFDDGFFFVGLMPLAVVRKALKE